MFAKIRSIICTQSDPWPVTSIKTYCYDNRMGLHRIAPTDTPMMTDSPKQEPLSHSERDPRRKDTLKYKFLVRPKKWIAQMCALPLAIVWLPVSCCFRNPAVAMARDDGALFDQFSPSEKAQDNIIHGCIVGALSTITLGCCGCGCLCDFDPDEL